ncbi:MAG: alpha/beta hydrolase domain-containing protein [Nocardioidaceae bacterium]
MKIRLRPFARTVAVAALAASLTLSVPATAESPGARAGSPQQGPVLTPPALRQLLLAQALPTTELIPTTATSHPWNGAAWQNKPIDLSRWGYVEEEYYLSGTSHVYDWIPGSDYATRVLASGDYTTRLDVRRPRNMHDWSGTVVVEVINMSAGYDWTAIWSSLWQRVLHDKDIYVGITSKPNVLPGLEAFDAARYNRLSWANPLPADQQTCGSLPGDPGYDPNLSRLYENGLVWDVLSQAGRLLKSTRPDNPLGRPARQVILSGESQSSSFLLTYYRYFSRSAVLPSGRPFFDAYFAETQVGIHSDLGGLIPGDRINQCAQALPDDDPQDTTFPQRSVPWIGINSGWDYPGVRGWTAPPDSNTRTNKVRFWELAGSNHGWEWQYLYGDANATDLLKAGFWDPATYDWSCGPNNPEVPFWMAEKAAYEQLKRWAAGGPPPARAPRILTHDTGTIDTTLYDGLGNAQGGIRFPMVEVPVASFGPGQYALTGDCADQIKPFDATTLASLYPTRADYLRSYRRATLDLLADGFILREDVRPLLALAARVTSIPAQGS